MWECLHLAIKPLYLLSYSSCVVWANKTNLFKQKKKLRSRQKKLKVYNLATLSESLPELKAPRQPIPAADLKLNCKARQKLMCVVQGYVTLLNFLMPFFFFVLHLCTCLSWHRSNGCVLINRLKEGRQLSTVLNHPAFQVDPLAAINQHLESTQPVSDEKPKKKMNKNGSKKRKGKSKTADRAQSMDVWLMSSRLGECANPTPDHHHHSQPPQKRKWTLLYLHL